MRPLAIVTSCVFLMCAPAMAQLAPAPMPDAGAEHKEPTLEETQQWIVAKFREVGTLSVPPAYDSDREHLYRYEAYFENCKFGYIAITKSIPIATDAPDPTVPVELRYGNLSDLDHTEIIRGESITTDGREVIDMVWGVHPYREASTAFAAMNGDVGALGRLIVSMKNTTPQYNNSNKVRWIGFEKIDPEIKRRINTAYLHAAKLCRAIDGEQRRLESAKKAKRPDEAF